MKQMTNRLDFALHLHARVGFFLGEARTLFSLLLDRTLADFLVLLRILFFMGLQGT